MIFELSNVASSLHSWEAAEYVSEGFVILGCAGELVADFFTKLPEKARRHIGTASTVVLILALTIGLKCLIKTNELSGNVIDTLGDKAQLADDKASQAMTDSGNAFSQASDAEAEVGKAKALSSNALVLARAARRAADSSKEDADEAQKESAADNERTKRLEAQLSWRAVTPKQKADLGRKLLQSGSLLPLMGLEIRLAYENQCNECEEFMIELREALEGFGARVSDDTEAIVLPPSPREGVLLEVNPKSANEAGPNLLLQTLKGLGIAQRGEVNPSIPPEVIQITVFQKPHGTQ